MEVFYRILSSFNVCAHNKKCFNICHNIITKKIQISIFLFYFLREYLDDRKILLQKAIEKNYVQRHEHVAKMLF